MKWPFARHPSSAEVTETRHTQNATNIAPTAGSATASSDHGGAHLGPTRREWATLAPLQVAGSRPMNLTTAPLKFIEQLATRPHLVTSPRMSRVPHLDAPSGSFHGVLSPATSDDIHAASIPELHEPSALPAFNRRHLAAAAAREHGDGGASAIAQLLAIGTPDAGPPTPTGPFNTRAELDRQGDELGHGDGSTSGSRRRSGLANSRRLGLGPAYHGPLPEAMRAERERDQASASVHTEEVPGEVRAALRDVLGLDIGDRLVHRGPAVSAEAQGMGAQAFTREGQVFIADEVGPLDQAKGKSTLAHELTHAAQQVVYGAPPDEGSLAGQMLEAQAQRVEQYVRGDGGATKPTPDLLHARPRPGTDQSEPTTQESTRQMMREFVDSGLARHDGTGGIIFTLPPSSMTASAGTQRQATSAATAQPTTGVHQDHWDPLASLGNTLGQGFSNDMLSFAGSFGGLSDESVGEQRDELANENLQFRREQTSHAYSELRMEHLRGAELTRRNAEEASSHQERTTSLDQATLNAIERQVEQDVNHRMALLETQTSAALEQLNRQRATRHEAALRAIPQQSYDAALRQLFDDAAIDNLPADAAVLSALISNAGTGHGASPAGGAAHGPGGAATGAAIHAPGTTGAPTGAGTTSGARPGGTPGASTPQTPPEEHWRTDSTLSGRFDALGGALGADFFSDKIDAIGSMFGFDDSFAESLQIGGSHPAAATPAATTPAATTPGATASSAAGVTGAAAAHPTAAHETVETIVRDEYSLEELAMRLYPSIRSRLRHELLIDRERAGLLADFR